MYKICPKEHNESITYFLRFSDQLNTKYDDSMMITSFKVTSTIP